MRRGLCETVAQLATPMQNKHWLQRREVYLPKGACFSTKLWLHKGVPRGLSRSG